MKRFFLLFSFFFLTTIRLWAYDFIVDSVYYSITSSNTVAVTFGSGGWEPYFGYNYSSPLYTGDVLIPSTVSNSSVVYTVTSVDDYAFYQCTGLTNITLPSTITSIGTEAFGLCTNLNLINLPETITSFGSSPFSNTKWYDSQPNGLVFLGKYLCGYKGSMPPNTTINVPEGTIGIINGAFVFCSNLTNINISSSVLNLPNDAFSYCTSLVSISVDETNLNFKSENGVLFNKDKTKILCCPESRTGTYVIPSSVAIIAKLAFVNCIYLTSVTIPNSVIIIEDQAFDSCKNLNSVEIPNSVTFIGKFAFSDCKGLTSLTIPNSVTSTLSGLFSGCTGLNSVVIPNTLTSIGDETFEFCTSLTSITIPNSVTSIGASAFYNCSSLTSVIIPNSVTSIGVASFSNCTSLIYVTTSNTITSIGDDTFEDCTSLTSITIPNSVTSIGNFAFWQCSNLSSIHSNSFSPIDLSSSTGVFQYMPTWSCVLYIPTGSKTAYQNALVWKDFANIVEENTVIQTVSASDLGIKIVSDKAILSKLSMGEMVEVFTYDGMKMFSGKATGTYLEIQLPTNKIYLIKVGAKCTKIMM